MCQRHHGDGEKFFVGHIVGRGKKLRKFCSKVRDTFDGELKVVLTFYDLWLLRILFIDLKYFFDLSAARVEAVDDRRVWPADDDGFKLVEHAGESNKVFR